MSLAVAFKGPEGIVLAADSRVTMQQQITPTSVSPGSPPVMQVIPSYFDNARKLLRVEGQSYVGVVTYGAGAIGTQEPRTAHGYMPEFEAHLATVSSGERLRTEQVARELGQFFTEQWTAAGMPAVLPAGMQPMVFLVGGFDDAEAYGRVYEVTVPTAPDPIEKPMGLTMGGQNELAFRLIGGFDPRMIELTKTHLSLDDAQSSALTATWRQSMGLPIPFQFLPLQDCVDLSTFMVTMTSIVQTWMFGIRGVGGEVDVATITRTEGFRSVQQKSIRPWE